MRRVSSGFVAALAIAFGVAGAGSLAPDWWRWAFLAAGIVLAAVWLALIFSEKREGRRREELGELLDNAADIGQRLLGRGPTFDAWRRHSQDLLAAAIADRAVAEAHNFPVASVVADLDPMQVLGGYPFGQEYITALFNIVAKLDEFPLRNAFEASAWAPFDPEGWEQEHARQIKWEPQNGAPCPWCGYRIYPTSGTCSECGAQVGAELAFK
jgi:hypothetical protein